MSSVVSFGSSGFVLYILNTYVGYVGSGSYTPYLLYIYTAMAGLVSASVF